MTKNIPYTVGNLEAERYTTLNTNKNEREWEHKKYIYCMFLNGKHGLRQTSSGRGRGTEALKYWQADCFFCRREGWWEGKKCVRAWVRGEVSIQKERERGRKRGERAGLGWQWLWWWQLSGNKRFHPVAWSPGHEEDSLTHHFANQAYPPPPLSQRALYIGYKKKVLVEVVLVAHNAESIEHVIRPGQQWNSLLALVRHLYCGRVKLVSRYLFHLKKSLVYTFRFQGEVNKLISCTVTSNDRQE